VGKSTLLNRLVGEHVAIVSPRPQTTRHRILGVVTHPGTQLCLFDVPGVHRAKGALNQAMVDTALGAMSEVDVILYLAEAGWPSGAQVDPATVDPVGAFHRELLEQVKRARKPVVLVLTKVDLVPKPLLLPLMHAWSQAADFAVVYPLSGLTGENVEGFLDALRPLLPEGGPLFPADTITDQPERALCAELIREQVFLQTRDEIPYGTAVAVETFEEENRPAAEEDEEPLAGLAAPAGVSDAAPEGEEDEYESDEDVEEDTLEDEAVEVAAAPPVEEEAPTPAPLGKGLVRINATIVVERGPHKAIVIGAGGQRLKEIGTAARHRIERLLGCRVWLGLHVRVIPNWTSSGRFIAEFGYGSRD
jgi:GTP-binding protein Era